MMYDKLRDRVTPRYATIGGMILAGVAAIGVGSVVVENWPKPYTVISEPTLAEDSDVVQVKISNGSVVQTLNITCDGLNLMVYSEADTTIPPGLPKNQESRYRINLTDKQKSFHIDEHPACVDRFFTTAGWEQYEAILKEGVVAEY